MCAIKKIKNECGFALLNTLLFMFFLGLMGITLATIVIADKRMQVVTVSERQAFYAAQSGIEYAVKGIIEYALNNSNMNGLSNYTETVNTGNGSTCDIHLSVTASDELTITASGKTDNNAVTSTKTITYIDVSNYAIYTTGEARRMRTIPSGSVMENAQYLPRFDLAELRDLARPTQYYTGNLNLNAPFTFTRDITFVERNLIFGTYNWYNQGTYVVRGNVNIQTSWLPMGTTVGCIFQPESGAQFTSQWNFLWRSLRGGIISNGDLLGTTIWWLGYRFTVVHDRDRINDLMQYSVNGGPLIITDSEWAKQ
ncbi:MAG: hypothetical protein GF313_02585 [Caldithrix sp.]|nr:hypothetical protein [Caldithrix sp.]